ncbi:MAG: hypothetical protein EOP06_27390 [Proteobacteria bacterium]|nr:MAG: hypothetical protein EOP06_27390 [Pseudomonadota bacterium]
MSLGKLELRSFRNYRHLKLDLSPEITVFTGRNGIGKTTILEAVSLLGSGRSFRSARNLDFVQTKEEAAILKGQQLLGCVAKRSEEVVIGVGNTIAGVQTQRHHSRVHSFLHLPVHG